MNPAVDLYLKDGCGRCSLYQTPKCKVHSWSAHLIELRRILNDSDLTEELKWSQPCYTLNGKNVLILAAFKEYCTIAFFKGSLMNDTDYLLIAPGENSQATRQLRFTELNQVLENETAIRNYIQQAIDLERSGAKVAFKKESEALPEELIVILEKNPALKNAFEALTPGRQRGYTLFFSAAKQSKTRIARIEKSIPAILAGKGLNDR